MKGQILDKLKALDRIHLGLVKLWTGYTLDKSSPEKVKIEREYTPDRSNSEQVKS